MNSFKELATKNQRLDDSYLNHRIFDDLKGLIQFYDSLSMSVFHYPTVGTKAFMNMDTYVYSSILGTLESISHVLKNGRIGDGYALLRKYYDFVIINIYTNLYLDEERNAGRNFIEEINNWLNGSQQLPEYRRMSQYIQSSKKLKDLNAIFNKDERYKKIRDRCHDHLHYNFFKNVLSNDSGVYLSDRLQLLEIFCQDLRQLFIFHFGYIFFISDYYMSSSDYIDCLEMGFPPVDGSQYWVAPYIQEIFDDIVYKERPDVAEFILNSTSMELTSREKLQT
jgi:hypothetical protein